MERSHQSRKKLLTFSFQIKKGTLYPAVIGIATLTQGAFNGFWSAGNEKECSTSCFLFVLELIWGFFTRQSEICASLLNNTKHPCQIFKADVNSFKTSASKPALARGGSGGGGLLVFSPLAPVDTRLT